MNKHTERTGCYQESGEPEPRVLWAFEQGKWCYMTIKDAEELTPACFGCRRFKAERQLKGDIMQKC